MAAGNPVTTLGDATLRQLALNVLARYAGPAADAAAVAAASRRAYDDVVRVSAPLIGEGGVEALAGRAVHLAARKYPWLTAAGGGAPPAAGNGAFAQVVASLELQEAGISTEAAETLLAIWTGLFVTFIGESLTAGLLRKAWPDAFLDLKGKGQRHD